MRKVLPIFLIALCTQSYASSNWVNNVQNHLKKTKKCDLALYEVFKKREQRESSLQQSITDVTCIVDLTIAKGTIHEVTGCSLVWYNVETNTYRQFARTGPTMVKGKPCVNGGFEALLRMSLWGGMTVKKYISSESDTAKPTVIYSNNQKYTETLANAIKASKADRDQYKAEQEKEAQTNLAKRKSAQKKAREKEKEKHKEAKKVEELYE